MKKSLIWGLMAGLGLWLGPAKAGGLPEDFTNINNLPNDGWTFENRSDLIGDAFWSQGFANLFPAHDGASDSYLLGGVGQTAGNVLCDWVILPDLGFVEQLNFFTRTQSNSISADRLMIVHSPSGGINTGPCVAGDPVRGGQDFGDFVVIGAVNPNLQAGGYPEQWAEVNVPVNASGRLALVYFVEDVGQPPFNGNLIALDSLGIGPGAPAGTPTAVPGLTGIGLVVMSGLMLLLLWWHRRTMEPREPEA
ncbi:choice-of-anchor J domain-containing protein [Marinicella meishanensis]|uniref:choice-of-anchor J domain-containing protein n=1 Tax=Marinicella meishanensis TaxID=2873263 RepID=UPI001CBC1ED9|nr:choice-of-anchor J domain-containing protein [Marinicella sp. NBU2979]